jgi:hypothetical protein
MFNAFPDFAGNGITHLLSEQVIGKKGIPIPIRLKRVVAILLGDAYTGRIIRGGPMLPKARFGRRRCTCEKIKDRQHRREAKRWPSLLA